jgi:hypothetical protein
MSRPLGAQALREPGYVRACLAVLDETRAQIPEEHIRYHPFLVKCSAWRTDEPSMTGSPPLPSIHALRALLGTVLLGALILLGTLAPRAPVPPEEPRAPALERRVEILRLNQARQVSATTPGRALPALIALTRGSRYDDLRQQAAESLLDAVTRAPSARCEGLDAAIRYVYVSAEDPILRERALLFLLSGQLEQLPEGAQGAFLAAILPQVLRSSQRHRLPPSVALAQAVLESGWGRSRLAREHHNLFGVKAGGHQGGVAMPTREHLEGGEAMVHSRFRAFADTGQSIEHHARLLAGDQRYAAARANWSDWRGFLRQLAPTYATDPAYAQRVAQLVERYHLDRWDPLVQAAAVNDGV